MAKYYRGDVNENGVVFSPNGSRVLSGFRGKPSADMLEAECDEAGNLKGNHRPILLADLKRQEAARKKAEAALAPRETKQGANVVRWYMAADGTVQPFGRGPVSYEKWATQVFGPDNPVLIRPECTEQQFQDWKLKEGYKVREGGSSGNPKLRDELGELKAQLAQQQEAAARQTALLEQLLAAQTAPTASGKASKASKAE